MDGKAEAFLRSFEAMPDGEKTLEACMAAVRLDGLALEDVPEDMRTAEVCFAAMQAPRGGPFSALPSVPQELRTEELCLAAVRQCGLALEFVPLQFRTPALCLEAVRQDGRLLELVPRRSRTQDVCEAAVLAGGDDAIFSVPERFRTPSVCLASADPDRWQSGWAAARRTAEALPRRFFKGGVLKPDIESYFSRTENGRRLLAALKAPDGRMRRVGRRPWSGDETLEEAWESPS